MTDVRETVSRAYEEALDRSKKQTGGCCGSTPCSTVAGVAGYGEETKSYDSAAQSSFGCGNPLAFTGVEKGQTVLDLGSGAGLDLLIAADRVGPEGRVIGVDMTDAMLEAARENAVRAGKSNIELRKGFIEELPVEDGSVDWVISNCVINLSPDKEKVFAELARVLKPGGRFAISDIVVKDLPESVRQSAAAYTACVAGAISEEEYVAGLRRAGLGEVEVIERIVYDAAQIATIAGQELGIDTGAISAADIEGRIWSAKFAGSK